MSIGRAAVVLLLSGGLLAAHAVAVPSAPQTAWERSFSVYSSSSTSMAARRFAYWRLRILDPKVRLPHPTAKAGLVFPSTSTVSGLITKASGGTLLRHDKAMVVFPANSVPADFAVSLSTPAGYFHLEETLKSAKMDRVSLSSASLAVELKPEGSNLTAPATIYVPYDLSRVLAQSLHELDLQVFRWNRDKQVWEGYITNIDLDRHIASATIARFGLYQVLGRKPRQKTP